MEEKPFPRFFITPDGPFKGYREKKRYTYYIKWDMVKGKLKCYAVHDDGEERLLKFRNWEDDKGIIARGDWKELDV